MRAEQKHGLEGLDAEDGRFEELDRAPVHLDQAASALAVRNGGGGLLLQRERQGGGGRQREQRRHIHITPESARYQTGEKEVEKKLTYTCRSQFRRQ